MPQRVAVLVSDDDWSLHFETPRGKRPNGQIYETTKWMQKLPRIVRSLGCTCRVIPYTRDVPGMVRSLCDPPVDLVLNLAEHLQGDRGKDVHAAALLELLDIPFTGAGVQGLMLCRDKALSKRLVTAEHIDVPRFASIGIGERRSQIRLRFPVIVKPQFGDGSDWVSLKSVVRSDTTMLARVKMLHFETGQPAICEEYIDGREVKVAVVGNGKRLHVFPPRETMFGSFGSSIRVKIHTSAAKCSEAYRERYGLSFPRAVLTADEASKLTNAAQCIYRTLRMRDYGRIDFRLSPDGQVYFLEANPNPDLSPEGFGQYALWEGVSYSSLIRWIVDIAWRRIRARHTRD